MKFCRRGYRRDVGFSTAIAEAEGDCAMILVDPFAFTLERGEHLAVEFARVGELDRHRVDEVAVDDHLVVQVRAGGQPCFAEIANGLALDDVGALDDAASETGHVIVGGHVAVGVLDFDPPPVACIPARLNDDAVAGGENRRADRPAQSTPVCMRA